MDKDSKFFYFIEHTIVGKIIGVIVAFCLMILVIGYVVPTNNNVVTETREYKVVQLSKNKVLVINKSDKTKDPIVIDTTDPNNTEKTCEE